ncbi:hypothetical protein K469DRAFT_290522 [Zopfia rhizophila CBS 207.26]|uniref:Uncharacterized protein n=1 Tax=Zopfia rhizophila CBS 207.26 TaxID=1314779 RepID=A0A6A6DMI9_9PEZI|nr:hypothetical protein K469DRAFT_290522 [Zopfia rhizophila CBS 207.26]
MGSREAPEADRQLIVGISLIFILVHIGGHRISGPIIRCSHEGFTTLKKGIEIARTELIRENTAFVHDSNLSPTIPDAYRRRRLLFSTSEIKRWFGPLIRKSE